MRNKILKSFMFYIFATHVYLICLVEIKRSPKPQASCGLPIMVSIGSSRYPKRDIIRAIELYTLLQNCLHEHKVLTWLRVLALPIQLWYFLGLINPAAWDFLLESQKLLGNYLDHIDQCSIDQDEFEEFYRDNLMD